MSQTKKEIIGKNLKEIREVCGITQRELAEGISLSVQAISAIENGKNAVSVEDLDRIIQFYNDKDIPLSVHDIPIVTPTLKTIGYRSDKSVLDIIITTTYAFTPESDADNDISYGKYNDINIFTIVTHSKRNIFRDINSEEILGGVIWNHSSDNPRWEEYVVGADTANEIIKHIKDNDSLANRATVPAMNTYLPEDSEDVERIRTLFILNDGLLYNHFNAKSSGGNSLKLPDNMIPEVRTHRVFYEFLRFGVL